MGSSFESILGTKATKIKLNSGVTTQVFSGLINVGLGNFKI